MNNIILFSTSNNQTDGHFKLLRTRDHRRGGAAVGADKYEGLYATLMVARPGHLTSRDGGAGKDAVVGGVG